MREMEGEALERLCGLAILIGASATIFTLLMAVPLAKFFGQPKVADVVALTSITFLLGSAQAVPNAVLQRAHRFRVLAAIEFANLTVGATTVLAGAFLGFGYWSLALAPIISGSVTLALLVRLAPVRPRTPRLSLLREALTFSSHVFATRLGGYLLFTADFLVVGRMLGESALGSYQFAWSLSNTPNDQVNGLAARVSSAFYSSLQGNRDHVGQLFLQLLEAVSIVSVPLTIGMALVAPDFVLLVLGSNWQTMVVPLQILCVFNALRVSSILSTPALTMVGDVRFSAALSIIGLIYIPAGFVIIAKTYGLSGIAWVWLFGYPPLMIAILHRLLTQLQLRWVSLFGAMIPAFFGSLLMTLVVLGAKVALPISTPVWQRLVVSVIVGAFTYIFVLTFAFPTRMRAVLTFLRTSR
jgi:PST family polysaccharide transporter